MSYFLAWFYRNNYDPQKILVAYALYLIPFIILGLLLQLKLILIIGIYLFGLVVVIFRNNTYFNE
ncbi:hypothetical protein IW492_11035 [Enterococcus sp. BWB1-3]|uniref:hypothetical protein n=1 Tax=unclassified Enterococcus TaxID=2608891 RepID=UPI00192478BE|nr:MULTISPECIES: hypothetical protein [unclassified Enterococcus]MBL1229765.1 hypothetical protein [Enterococcus sp. BWB1-3]MCB5953000.1 hypothetical protein [Enterococcus sp. BWT-B8]MCB5956263.1 hypothetical protein [Enterococcus sp. CWB-B31]